MPEILLANFTSPLILCFLLGLIAGLLKSDLHLPEQFIKGVSIYLMLAIGLHGGTKLRSVGLESNVVFSLLMGGILSFALPFLAFYILKYGSKLDHFNAAAIAAHYGSISIVNFAGALEFLKSIHLPAENFLVAVAAIMETPAIIAGVILSRQSKNGKPKSSINKRSMILKEIFFHGSILLLMGGFIIGFIAGPDGMTPVKPFFFDLFKGFLCFFLLDIGILVAQRLSSLKEFDWKILLFGIYMPLINALIGALIAHFVLKLSLGGIVIFTSLCGSASYIAVPAAMRLAVPKANPALYLTLSLGVTFPLNLSLGLPLYLKIAQYIQTF